MPITRHHTGRWLYQFDRVIAGTRQRANRLLPAGWSKAQAQAFDRVETARLYALAAGVTRPTALIEDAVLLYLQQHAPALKNFTDLRGALALCQPWYAGQPMADLASVARRYATDMARALSPATVRNRLAYLRAACRWAWRTHGMGEHDPAERMLLPRVKNERHIYIERGAVLQLARAIHNRDARACVLVAYYSGMRLGEILRAQRTPAGWLLTDTKNGQRRLVPVHPAVSHIARRWPLKVAGRTVQGQFARAAATLGYTDLHFHDLRHSAASGMINAGVDLYTVGGVLGHKSSQSTQRYAHLKTASLQSAIAKIGARNAKRVQP